MKIWKIKEFKENSAEKKFSEIPWTVLYFQNRNQEDKNLIAHQKI